MKKLLLLLLVLAVLAGGALLLVIGSLGKILRAAVERVGSEATQAPVTLQTVDLSASDGRGELRELVIGNPEGFSTDHAMRLGVVRVVIDTSTLTSDPIVVKEVVIEEPQIIYEVGSGRTNIGTIQENVEAFARRLGAGSGGGSEAGDEGTKVVIEHVYVRGGRVAVSASFLGGRDVGVDLDDIHLRDLGKDSGGVTAGKVAAEVLRAITTSTLRAVSKLDLEGMRKGIRDVLDDPAKAVEGVGGALEGILGK